MRSATSGKDSIDGQEVVTGPSVLTVPCLAKSSELIHSSRPTTAIMTSSFAGSFRAVRERLA